jgi:thioester reductase-like protein
VTALITGFPGFIGRRLVHALRTDRPELDLVCLVEARMADTAREIAPEGVEVVVGDIAARRLGLADADWDRLTQATRHVFHLAAIYDLAVPAEIAQRVNVDGTGNVLEFCHHADGLERLTYVSTAYVAGDRHGTVYEHELALGQGFKNHYEATKFQAEVWVREEMHRFPTTILRPAIVVGDSKTGETEKFDGPYYLLRGIDRMQQFGRPAAVYGRGDAPFNVVPVDFVVAAIAQSAFLPEAAGETLHLVDPDPVTSGELTRLLQQARTGRDPQFKLPAKAVQGLLRSKTAREFFGGTPAESIVYLNHRVSFDTRRCEDLLGPLGLTPPSFASYVDAMVSYYAARA